jgi:glyoxylase-like metal-dependent hydrolase (beta-lactamase superfamily II)
VKSFNYIFCISLLIAIFSTVQLNGQQKADSSIVYADSELIVKTLDPETYLVIHTFPWPANSLAIRFEGGNYLFIDTPYTDEATEKLVSLLQSRDSVKIKVTAINTHFHVDNLGGNGYLKSIGATSYGSDLTARLLKEKGLGTGMLESFKTPAMEKYYNYYKDKVLVAPEKLFPIEDGLKLFYGKDTVEAWYPGPGHTQDNIVVYLPSKKLLFGGCILKSMESNTKGNTGDADLKNWGSSLEKLLARYPEAKLVIPGHGNYGGIELIKHSIDVVK